MTSADRKLLDELSCCNQGDLSCRFSHEIAQLKQEVSQLSEMVRTDALTGLYNFRFLNETLVVEIERVKRGTSPLALIMVDIDHFKKLNDTFGHENGNLALTHVAKLIKLAIRKLDIPCRFGGEEFVIMLPNTELSSAVAVAERLREMIASTPLTLLNDKAEQVDVNLTASLGVDIFSADLTEEPTAFLQRADHWLYEAKHAGRNRTCFPELKLPVVPESVSTDEKEALFNLFANDE